MNKKIEQINKFVVRTHKFVTTIRSDGMGVELTWSIKRQIFLEIKAATYNI